MTEPTQEEINALARQQAPHLFNVQESTGLDLSGKQAMQRTLRDAGDTIRVQRNLNPKWVLE